MKNLVIAGAYNQGIAGFRSKIEDPSVAAMMEPAIWQRNVQWAGEGDLFKTFVRPVITFIEGFIVAVTPMMALMIAASLSGIMLVFSYLKMTIWVQLWFPLLAIINLFLTMAMARDLDSVAAVDTIKPASIEASWGLIQTASTHIATAGMLAAAVPALAYALISMSPMAFTHLMGRLQGSDTVNEKILAPDVMTPSTGVKMDAVKTGSEFGGVAHTGADGEAGTWSISQSHEERLNAASQASYRAADSWNQTVSNIAGRNAAVGNAWDHSLSKAFRSDIIDREARGIDQTETDSFREDIQNAFGQNFTIGSKTIDTGRFSYSTGNLLDGLIGWQRGSAKAQAAKDRMSRGDKGAEGALRAAEDEQFASITKALPDLGITMQDIREYNMQTSSSFQDAQNAALDKAVRSNKGYDYVMARATAIAAQDLESQSASLGLSENDQRQLAESSSELRETTESWGHLQSSGTGSAVEYRGSLKDLSRAAELRGPGYVNGLVDQATNLGLGGTMNNAYRYATNRLGMEGDQANAYAALTALAGGNNAGITPYGNEQPNVAAGRAAFAEVIGDLTPRAFHHAPVADAPPDHLGATGQPGAAREAVEGGVRPWLIPAPGQADGRVAAAREGHGDMDTLRGAVTADQGDITDHFGEAYRMYLDRKNMAHGEQDMKLNVVAQDRYMELAQHAATAPAPNLAERTKNKLLEMKDDVASIATGNMSNSIERYIEQAESNGLGDLAPGYAAGAFIANSSAYKNLTVSERANKAGELLALKGYPEEEIMRQMPLAVMAANNHTNVGSEAVQGMVKQVRAIDNLRRND